MDNKWDIRFLALARFVSSWSKDPSTKTGAAIVRCDKKVVAIGYNGFPRTMPDVPEWYEDRLQKYSRIVHCEMNALISATTDVRGCILYTWPFACCDRCVVQMLQAGITRFVFPEPPEEALPRWADALAKTKQYMRECGAQWTEIPRQTLIF